MSAALNAQEAGITAGGLVDEVQDLCEFVSHRAAIDGIRHSTIKVSLFALRRLHVEQGLPSPVSGVRLRMTLEGIKRSQGRTQQKAPVTMAIIRKVASRLDLSAWDDLVQVTAIVTMFMFLLRSGEALKTGKDQDMQKCLKVNNKRSAVKVNRSTMMTS